MVVDFVLGRVLLDKVEPRMLEVDTFVGLVTPVRREPFLDIEFVTELLEALELDLLRFSLELVGCCLFPILGMVVELPLDFVKLRTLRIFSVDR